MAAQSADTVGDRAPTSSPAAATLGPAGALAPVRCVAPCPAGNTPPCTARASGGGGAGAAARCTSAAANSGLARGGSGRPGRSGEQGDGAGGSEARKVKLVKNGTAIGVELQDTDDSLMILQVSEVRHDPPARAQPRPAHVRARAHQRRLRLPHPVPQRQVATGGGWRAGGGFGGRAKNRNVHLAPPRAGRARQGSPADGHLTPGDRIVEVEGQSVSGKTHKQKIAMITQYGSKATLELTVAPAASDMAPAVAGAEPTAESPLPSALMSPGSELGNSFLATTAFGGPPTAGAASPEAAPTQRQVVIDATQALGIEVAESEFEDSPFQMEVLNVDPNGAAAASGPIFAADSIVAINGEDTEGKEYAEVLQMLVEAKKQQKLVLDLERLPVEPLVAPPAAALPTDAVVQAVGSVLDSVVQEMATKVAEETGEPEMQRTESYLTTVNTSSTGSRPGSGRRSASPNRKSGIPKRAAADGIHRARQSYLEKQRRSTSSEKSRSPRTPARAPGSTKKKTPGKPDTDVHRARQEYLAQNSPAAKLKAKRAVRTPSSKRGTLADHMAKARASVTKKPAKREHPFLETASSPSESPGTKDARKNFGRPTLSVSPQTTKSGLFAVGASTA